MGGAEHAVSNSVIVDDFKRGICSRAALRAVVMKKVACPDALKRMACDWTQHVALRRAGRPEHSRFYKGVEQLVESGGIVTARIAACMVTVYETEYPGSYGHATAGHSDGMSVGWNLVLYTQMVGGRLLRSCGGALQVAYISLYCRRIDWFVYALGMLPPGPRHAAFREGADGVANGVRLGIAVVNISRVESSPFIAAIVSMLACVGYAENALHDSVSENIMSRNNARHVLGSYTVAAVLTRLVREHGKRAQAAVFVLLSQGILCGPARILPALSKFSGGGDDKLFIAHNLPLWYRFINPVVSGDRLAVYIALGVCLARREIPSELASLVLKSVLIEHTVVQSPGADVMQITRLRTILF